MNAVVTRSLELGFAGHPTIIRSLDLRVPKRRKVALVGPNGGGKTTLLRALAGELSPLAGSIEILGQTPALARRSISYLPQTITFDKSFPITLWEFVALGTLPRRSWWSWLTPGKKQKVDQIMARLNLRELAHKPISQLSGGQLQRGILARGLIRDAEVLLFDEPLSAVDGMNRRLVWEALDLAVEEGATLLFVTHNSEDSSRCDICLQVDRGLVS